MAVCVLNTLQNIIPTSNRISANSTFQARSASKIAYGLIKASNHLFTR